MFLIIIVIYLFRLKYFVTNLFHNLGTWVEILVNPMPESHESKGISFILSPVNEFRYIAHIANLLQHGQYSFIGSTMQRSPE